MSKFQSTRPLRGATLDKNAGSSFFMISIHAPLTGRDSKNAQIISCTFVITDSLSRKSTCIALSARMLFRYI